MPNDLLVYEIFDLPGLVQRGILRPLGGNRYQFTREHVHQPSLYPDPTRRPNWKLSLSDIWTASAGAVIGLLDMGEPAPTVQRPGQQGYTFQFEISTAYEGYAGPVQYIPDQAPVTPVVDAGPDQNVQARARVTLVGKLNPLIKDQRMPFNWIQLEGPVVTLSDIRSLEPTFDAPNVSVPTQLAFQLVATDGGNTYSDNVILTVLPV